MSRAVANIEIATDTFQQWVVKTNDLAALMSNGVVTVAPTATGDISTGNGTIVGTLVSTVFVANGAIRGGNLTTNATLTVADGLAVTGNASATVAVNVGANVTANTTALRAGNSTVQTVIGFGTVSVGANVTANTTAVKVGNNNLGLSAVGVNTAVVSGQALAVNGSALVNGTVTANGTVAVKTSRLVSNTANATSGATTIDSFPLTETSSAKYLISVTKPSATPPGRHSIEMLLIHDSIDVYTTRYAEIYNSNTSLGTFAAVINGANVEIKFTPAVANTYNATTLRIQA